MSSTDRVSPALPTGTVTFLFSDIQGSTRLLQELGDRYAEVLLEHRRVLRAAFAAHGGVEVGTEGDSFFVAFTRASDAVAAAARGQRGLEGGPVSVRIGIHAGEPTLTAEGYVGLVVHRAARIAAAGHGGQVLLSQAVADLAGDRMPAGVALRDLGRVRLKDLATPERIYQLLQPQLRQDFPALRTLEATPNNLPQPLTSFIGREKAIGEIERLLETHRLLTLTGSGGSGKTRLSLHVAADILEHFPDGAWFVELASLTDPRLVPHAAATVLGVKEEPGRPMAGTLAAHLEARRVLLLLDNCEHLVGACAELADALVRMCPGVTILASSREALNVAGERTYRVPSLSLPNRRDGQTPQSLAKFESVQLFIDRALLVRPDFEVTTRNAPALASLCHHVDGIPLAIELAAARVRSLAVEEIDGKLDRHFRLLTGGPRTALPRHRTLRALIDWSYDLLQDRERLLLQRLAVFAGGWTLAGAETVCSGEGVDGDEVLALLISLADKSLVVPEERKGQSRYQLLEMVRQYADEKLLESAGAAAVRQRHFEYFLALAEEVAPKLTGAEQAVWLERMDEERGNFRSALEWSLLERRTQGGLRICGALRRFWWARGYLAEGRQWCARVLAGRGGEERTRERAEALNAAGALAYFQADYSAAKALYEAGLAIMRELGDLPGVARLLANLGGVACDQGDFVVARARNGESLAIWRTLADPGGLGHALNNLGNVALDQGDLPAAKALYEESLAIWRPLGDKVFIAIALGNLGIVAHEQGEFALARSFYDESIAISRELGDRIGVGRCLVNLGAMANLQGERPAAAAALRQGLAILLELGDRIQIAYALEGLAEAVGAFGDQLRAARIWGRAAQLREEIGSPLPEHRRPAHLDAPMAAVRAALADDAAFERARQEGRALTLEQAIELALSEEGAPPR